MGHHFFMLMYGTSGNERNETRFQSFTQVGEAVLMVQDWLKNYCSMDCVPAVREVELREKNGGELPEDVFLCPAVTEPKDLEKYNGFYNYESLGVFNLFLTPVYDTASAKSFKGGMIKEFGIDQEYSDRADRMLAHLNTFVNSFEDSTIDYTGAEEAIRKFLIQGGFDLFDFGEYVPDTIVIPGGSNAQFHDI